MEQREKRIKKVVADILVLEGRVKHLELVAHSPVNWEKKIKSLEDAYNRLYDLIRDKIGDK